MAIGAFIVAVGTFGCAGSGPSNPSLDGVSDPPGSGGTSGGPISGGGFGRLTLNMTDTPFEDAKAVLITFDRISVHRSGGGWEDIDFANDAAARTCDLKKLEDDEAVDVLGSELLPAGHYTQIVLNVAKATIHFDNASTSATACAAEITVPGTKFTDVRVPNGEVKLNREFRVDPDALVDILLDFDGDKSIRQQGGGGGNGNGRGRGGAGGGTTAPEEGSYSLQPVVSILEVTAPLTSLLVE
jgi:hypothetical protein